MQYSEDELRAAQTAKEGISLILNISAGDVSSFGSRADGDNNYFEQNALNTEKIQSLRIIIVDVQEGSETCNRVIHNYTTGALAYARFNLSGIRFDGLNFSNDYRIYLIANENTLPDNLRTQIRDLGVDSECTPGTLENVVISNQANIANGSSLLNNEQSYIGNSGSVKAIPMTEFFNITTDPRPDSSAEEITAYMQRSFFITRAASKFTFRFKRGEYVSSDEIEIKAIKISGLGNMEYLFPNETVYDPIESEPSENEYGGRFITSFKVPDESTIGDYTFSFSQKVSEIPTTGIEYNPLIYFPDSKGEEGAFQCSLSFDGETFTSPVTLPNLNALPRNTHVEVVITIKSHSYDASVTLVPYIGVDLTPDFGFNDLDPSNKNSN